MTNPIRWSASPSEVDPVIRAVMRYAQAVEPSAERVSRLAANVAIAAGGTTAAGSVTWLKLVATKALWLLSGAAVMGGGLAAYDAAISPISPPAVPTRPLTGLAPSSWSPSEVIRRHVEDRPRHLDITATKRGIPSHTDPRVVEPTDELALLQLGRAQLQSNANATLALLESHAEKYPRSAFAQERDALEVEALVRAGQVVAARRKLDAFAATYPGSLYLRRLEGLQLTK